MSAPGPASAARPRARPPPARGAGGPRRTVTRRGSPGPRRARRGGCRRTGASRRPPARAGRRRELVEAELERALDEPAERDPPARSPASGSGPWPHASRRRQPGRYPARRRRCPVAPLRGSQAQGSSAMTRNIGYDAGDRACKAPIPEIVDNPGLSGDVVANKVTEDKSTETSAYDARQDRYCDMVKEGIIDPTKVVRSAPGKRGQRFDLAADQRRAGRRMPKEEKKPAGGGGEDMLENRLRLRSISQFAAIGQRFSTLPSRIAANFVVAGRCPWASRSSRFQGAASSVNVRRFPSR